MKIKNKDVIQSYILTTAKYDFNVHEKRILYRLVELAQKDLEGKELGKGYSINKTLFDDRIVSMPIKAFLNQEKDKNHTRVKQALRDLRNKTMEFEDDKTWELIGIIEKPKIEKYDETVEIEINPKVWHAILSFAKGFRKYELKTAMSFDSIYAMRFYELFSGKKSPITYKVNNLKIMFNIEDKYTDRPAAFIEKVVKVAKRELDKKSPYSFEFRPEKTGRKITHITFFPVYISENRDSDLDKRDLQKKVSLSWDLDKMIVDYLKQNFNFTKEEVKYNIGLLIEANNELDLMLELSKLKTKAENKSNPKGYLINAIKGKLKDLK